MAQSKSFRDEVEDIRFKLRPILKESNYDSTITSAMVCMAVIREYGMDAVDIMAMAQVCIDEARKDLPNRN